MNRVDSAVKKHSSPINLNVTRSDSHGRVEFTLTYSDGRKPSVIYYESNSPGVANNTNYDSIMCAIIHLAMREVDKIYLHGSVSKKILLNLIEYQKAWVRWSPDKYSEVQIMSDEIVNGRCGEGEVISAYSGGVDAMFSLLQNTSKNELDTTSHNLTACLLVHGFDIPLSDCTAFETVREQAVDLHSHLGVDTFWIRTNSKEILGDWEASFAAQLMACLHLFSGRFDTALIGSSEPYDELVIPWGSSPITDHLLSGGGMDAVHYGAGYSRTEKVAYLSKFPLAVKKLRVCWQGSDKAKNCGTCEKCIRTRLNFEAVGLSDPECFSQPFDPSIVNRLNVNNLAQLQELKSISKYAKQRGNDPKWIFTLDGYINSWSPPYKKIILRKALNKLGLLESAKYIKSLVR